MKNEAFWLCPLHLWLATLFETWHLSSEMILGITWNDRITNTKVLVREQANLQSMCKRRLRWLGHVRRMDDTRISKQLLYGELAQGKRHRGRPKQGHLLENSMINNQIEKRQCRKDNNSNREWCGMSLICTYCDRSCASNIGRISHERSCKRRMSQLWTRKQQIALI